MMCSSYEMFLHLTRRGIGHQSYYPDISFDWGDLYALSVKHGLQAVVLDGIGSLPEVKRPNQEMLLNWIGEVLQGYEQRYALYEKAIGELASFYIQHGYKMMVLKGYACSLDWPKPNHRPCGDIDIWLFGKQKVADSLLEKEKGVTVDTSHHHHTVFDWKGFSVENHFDFINVHHHKSNARFEDILKELGKEDSHFVEIAGERVYLPSPNLHALFLLKHMAMHFAAEGIMLRQLVDWGLYVEKHSKEIDWQWLEGVIIQFGMKELYNVFNAICVGDLGFRVNIFPQVQFSPDLKDKVLKEILNPRFDIEPPKGFFKRIVFKVRRWKANEWKHKLCYKDSMWSAFWSGVRNHLLKPSSI